MSLRGLFVIIKIKMQKPKAIFNFVIYKKYKMEDCREE